MRFFSTIVLSSLAVLGLATPAPQSSAANPQSSPVSAANPQSSAASAGSSGGSANPFNVPTTGYSLKAGSPTTITWTPTTSGTVTLRLRSGSSNALNQGDTIASSIANSGSLTFTPPANTVDGSDYTIEIIDDSDTSNVNYTPQFAIQSSNTVSSASSSGSSTASATGSSSSASGSSSSSASASSASTSASSSSASASASKSSAAKSSAASSSASSSSATAQKTSAPTSGAQAGLTVQGGLLALIMGAAAAL